MEFQWAQQRSRTACAQHFASKIVRAEKAASQPRTLGRFVKTAPTLLPERTAAERAARREEVLQSRLDKHISESKERIAHLQAQHSQALANLNQQLSLTTAEVRSLRARLRLTRPSIERRVTPLTDGVSAPTQRKVAAELESFLLLKFATTAARDQALYEHFIRLSNRYTAITAHGLTLAGFQKACEENPEWVHPIRREVITKIEEFWTAEKCLSIQIHCKVGHGEKYQHLINIAAKEYNAKQKKWEHKELFEKGSAVYLPKFMAKNAVNRLREEIAEVNPLIQNEAGTACWLDLPLLVQETLRDEQIAGFLQSKEGVQLLNVWLHWGGDAAGFLRAIKHSKFGLKLVGNGRVCSQSPSNLRTILLFEGKDNYGNYKKYLQPFLSVMQELQNGALTVDGVDYLVKQTMGTDYVLLAEIMGHAGHSRTNGCCFCEIDKKHYGTIITDEEGRRVPLGEQDRTLKQMAAAAHRPLMTRVDVKCPYCGEEFPNEATVTASKGPETEAQRQAYQVKHKGMKFGCPPLFNFEVTDLYLCILHTLLRLIAVVFKRTIVVNLDTPEKVDAVNQFVKEAYLGCKKVAQRKKDEKKKKDIEDTAFTGRYMLTCLTCLPPACLPAHACLSACLPMHACSCLRTTCHLPNAKSHLPTAQCLLPVPAPSAICPVAICMCLNPLHSAPLPTAVTALFPKPFMHQRKGLPQNALVVFIYPQLQPSPHNAFFLQELEQGT
jgi:hypothetical protein